MSIGAIEIEIALTQNITITDDTFCVERWRGAWPAKNGSKINPSPLFVPIVLHRFLKAMVAFELKVGPFEPEYTGKMDFYLNLLNDKERADGDNPSIGIILCAEKDDVEVEYALKTKRNPIGVAEYHLQPKLPGSLKGKLPTAKQLADVVRTALPARGGK